MSTLTTPAVPMRFAQALATIVAAAARLAGRFAEAWRHRHDAAVLAALDDHADVIKVLVAHGDDQRELSAVLTKCTIASIDGQSTVLFPENILT